MKSQLDTDDNLNIGIPNNFRNLVGRVGRHHSLLAN